MKEEDFKKLVRDIPDFPKKGIVFKDIAPLFASAKAIKALTAQVASHFKNKSIDVVVGVEARGFLLGPLLADAIDASFVMVRKPCKLPGAVVSQSYALEYGEDTVEIQQEAFPMGSRVLLHDDVLATGGTAIAASQLIEKLGGTLVGAHFIIELAFLNGRTRFMDCPIHATMKY